MMTDHSDKKNASAQKLIPFRFILLCSIAALFFSCGTTRKLEKKQSKELYNSLGLDKDNKDNAELYREAASWLHVPHVDGGRSRKGTDCSFLVNQIYETVYNKNLERSSSAMLKKNCKRISRSRLREGDLVFFHTGGRSKSHVSHVGIYLKDRKFVHTSTSKGVIVSDLEESYYRRTWVCGGRVK